MRRMIDVLSKIGALVAGALIMGLIALTVADVAWRNLGGHSIPGVYEYSEVILVAIVFLSLAWTQKADAHVSIDLVTRALPVRLDRIVRGLGVAVALVVLAWMTVASIEAAGESWTTGEYRIGLSEVPVWPARFAVALGLCALVLQLAIGLLDILKRPGGR